MNSKHITDTSPESTETVDFGKTDSKGRRVGAVIVRDNAGLWFTYHIQTTRNGSRYGACQPTHYFATVEERDVAIHAHLARSMKAAAKKADTRC